MAYTETRIAELEAEVHELANEVERLRSELAKAREHILLQAYDVMKLGQMVYDKDCVEWKVRAEAAEAELAKARAAAPDYIGSLCSVLGTENERLREALINARDFIETTAFNVPSKDYFDAVLKDAEAALQPEEKTDVL